MDPKDKMTLAGRIAWIAAVFSLVMSVMLIFNYIQLKSVDPLETPALKSLVDQLRQNPQDEMLKENIRALDLMIRKAYFTSLRQIRTGSWLLVVSVLVLVLAVRYQKSLRPGLEELERIEKNPFLDKQQERKWLIYSGGGLFILALLSGFFSENILNRYETPGQNDQQVASAVEIIAVQPVQDEPEQTEEVADTEQLENQEAAAETEALSPVAEEKAPAATTLPSKEQIRKNYPFFRGPEGTGLSYKTGVPEKWNTETGENILWKVKIPRKGYSSPIIWGDRLFLTGADETARTVYCYDKNNGKLLWEANADQITGSPAKMPKVTEDTGLAAPSMATNGHAVFALFGTGDVISLNMSGKRLWAKNLGVPDNHYGHSSSLIIYKDKLLVQYDTNRGAKVMALAMADGSVKWETPRNVKISWASPVLVNTGSRDELILTGEPLVAGYDPETGKELWSVNCMMGEVGPSVGYTDGIVFAANEYATLAAIKLGAQPEVIWEEDEYLPEVASPLAANGLLIVGTSYGMVACYDALNGTKYWEQEFSSGIYASPVYADGKVYVMDMGGTMHVMKMAKEYQLIAESKLGEKTVCSPVFADGRMYLRGFSNLYCIGK
ncbi:PQQ-binding-like beta-propeller repeat protein [Gaoshiqia sp. Z1-71]|uniref:outer membrane protein assembly factor BamB family protein n=1 Tax=Gaoshiqia hydrogeniformans TaxID=3290090 RepID=UPI003BF7B020